MLEDRSMWSKSSSIDTIPGHSDTNGFVCLLVSGTSLTPYYVEGLDYTDVTARDIGERSRTLFLVVVARDWSKIVGCEPLQSQIWTVNNSMESNFITLFSMS